MNKLAIGIEKLTSKGRIKETIRKIIFFGGLNKATLGDT